MFETKGAPYTQRALFGCRVRTSLGDVHPACACVFDEILSIESRTWKNISVHDLCTRCVHDENS